MDEHIARASKWLMKAELSTTEDSVMQLLGAKWAAADGKRRSSGQAAKRLLRLQREDGGWAQTPYLKSDAYATATALYALKESPAVAEADAAYRKGSGLSTFDASRRWILVRGKPLA